MPIEFKDLPPEIVRHILNFVPSRWAAALVRKDFYEHVCDIEKDNYKLCLNSDIHVSTKNQAYIENLLESKRKICHISLSEAAGSCTNKLDVLFQKFGGNVKKLSVLHCDVKEKLLSHWLNMMPMLEEIEFSYMSISDEGNKVIPQLNLPRLIKVSSRKSEIGDRMYILRAFPKGVIQELSWINNFQDKKASSFLKKQPNIKKLTLGDESLAKESELNNLDLKILTIHNNFNVPCNMFCGQRNLTSLTLKAVPLDTAMFNIICSMKKLESLEFEVKGLQPSCLVGLETISLKSLAIENGDEHQLKTIVNLEMPTLDTLSLWIFPNIDSCWEAGHFENVKSVRCGPCHNLSLILSLTKSFPKLESIKISMHDGETVNQLPQMHPHGVNYGVLKNFYITHNPAIPKFLDVVPFIDFCENLEEISIYAPMPINFLRHLLSTNLKLRKLAMSIDKASSLSDDISSKISSALVDNAPQLSSLFLVFTTNTWNMTLDIVRIKQELGDRFPIIVKSFSDLTFKKRGAGEMEFWD